MPVFIQVERVVITLFVIVSVLLMFLTLERLLYSIIVHSNGTEGYGGNALLASAVGIWVVNVISFALLYWLIDRGGPDRRASGNMFAPDILFPEGPAELVRPYTFMDYLFYAYTNSTAFSPCEMFPTTARAKVIMMLQGTISLATIIFVAARAINILK